MSIFISEMKKMLFHQKGIWFIGLFFMLSMTTLFIFETPNNPDVELHAEQYDYYLQQVNGQYSEEIERFFIEESEVITHANVALEKVYNDYYDGEISEDEMTEQSNQLAEILANENGFKTIFEQYTYVRENPENRYFLATNGWHGLLATDGLDFLFLLLLLILITPVFCAEFASEMNTLHLTVRKGTRAHATSKIILVLMTVVGLCLIHTMLKYGFYELEYGLEHGNYPLQSLPYFGSSTKNITLFSTFIWLSVIKVFGYMSFAFFVMFISVWSKKYATTLFTSTTIILIPYFGLGDGSARYLIPGPLGWMISTGFFKGSELEYNIVTDQMDIIFEEISVMTIIILFVITLCLCICAVIVLLMKHTNVWGVREKVGRLKSVMMVLLVSLGFMILGGCNVQENVDDYDIYNYSSRQSFENDQYRFFVDELDLENIKLVFENKQTGTTMDLIRNPIQASTRVETSIYGNGQFVYYMKQELDQLRGFSHRNEESGRFFIMEVDTTTFDERVIFEKNIHSSEDNFLGIRSEAVTDANFYFTIDAFFLDKDHVYLIESDKIRRVNRLTGKATVIITAPLLTSVAFDGQHIYYINEQSQVVVYDTTTDIETVLSDIITPYFVLTDTELLFLNRKDQYKIYALHINDSTIQKMTDKSVLTFTVDDQYIYYEDREDFKKYRMDRDGRNDVLIPD